MVEMTVISGTGGTAGARAGTNLSDAHHNSKEPAAVGLPVPLNVPPTLAHHQFQYDRAETITRSLPGSGSKESAIRWG